MERYVSLEAKGIPDYGKTEYRVYVDGKYYGKSTMIQGVGAGENITSYYVKKFDNPAPRIVHVWVTDNPNELEIVDDTVFASTSSISLQSTFGFSL